MASAVANAAPSPSEAPAIKAVWPYLFFRLLNVYLFEL
jgi:hypothetical protein